jgi:hypothetical protein
LKIFARYFFVVSPGDWYERNAQKSPIFEGVSVIGIVKLPQRSHSVDHSG